MKLYSERAGKLYHVQSDYDCFIPRSLNEITINYDDELISLLSEANKAIGILDGLAYYLPDRDIFISKYVEKEAVVSSQIEGTQVSLADVFQFKKTFGEKRKETEEIINYTHALNYGINLLNELPISIRYLKKIHTELLKGVRGEAKDPGEIRKSQNWIGPNGCTLANATYVPPSVDLMKESLYDLELYMNKETEINPLIKIGLIHYQFETIHPFLDGNGRLGRVLIPLWLIKEEYLKYPLIYLSLFFKQNRTEYYGILMDVRFKGKYEEWLKFFLQGIIEMANSSIQTIHKITELTNDINNKINNMTYSNKDLITSVMKYIYRHPYFDAKDIKDEFDISKPTVSKIINELVNADIVSATSNKKRYVTYQFNQYIDLLEKGTEI